MSKNNFAIYPSLENKRVLISGGASGIGAEIVKAFAHQDANVHFLDRDAEASKALVESIGRSNVSFSLVDLCDANLLKEVIAQEVSKNGSFDVLVNNAARDDRHDWRDVTPEYFDERIATNLRHMFFSAQAVAPGMIEAGGGSIINMGSNSWWEAGGGFPVYATAKSAVHGLTRTLARDFGGHHIRVNTVVPGWIMTERQKELWVTEEAIEKHRNRQCLPELIEPVYVARMVLFLASDDARMCTANNYMVEAGSI